MEYLKKTMLGQWELLAKAPMSNSKNALGITSDKGKIKFDPSFGQKEFREYVETRADHMCDTGYLAGKPDDWNWGYIPDFAVEKLIPLKKDVAGWKSWLAGEMSEWVYDHGQERAGHFDRWCENPSVKPLIIVQGTDERPHQIDGHHRLATAIAKGMKTVPAIYGTRKNT